MRPLRLETIVDIRRNNKILHSKILPSPILKTTTRTPRNQTMITMTLRKSLSENREER